MTKTYVALILQYDKLNDWTEERVEGLWLFSHAAWTSENDKLYDWTEEPAEDLWWFSHYLCFQIQ